MAATENRRSTRFLPAWPKAARSVVIGQQVTDGVCQARHIFGGHQPAGFAMLHHLGEAAHVGSHHRQTSRHGLQNHVGKPLRHRTQRQETALPQ